MGDCCTPGAAGRPRSTPISTTTPAFINGLVSLYEAGFDERWIDAAVELADQMLAHFADRDDGGFFFTADDGEQLIARQKDLQDSATPSGNSMAATALVRLGKLTGRHGLSGSGASARCDRPWV